MSFIRNTENTPGFNAGYFLESEVGVVRKTRQIKAADAVTVGDEKYVLAGSLYSEGSEVGIVYEPVNVTSGDMPGSVVLAGRVYKDKLPTATASGVESAEGITLIDSSPAVTRPY